MTQPLNDAQGIQSIEVGGALLKALADSSGPMTLSALAAAAAMPASKARRYLLSFTRTGLVAQVPETGHYTVGPLALQLGLAAQRDLDIVREGGETVKELARALNHTVALIVWSDRGPVVVRFVASRHNVAIFVRVGSIVPLAQSAAGKLFLTHLPAEDTRPILEADAAASAADLDHYRSEEKAIRQQGYAVAEGAVVPGIFALATPVFDGTSTMVAALVAYGPENALDVSAGGEPVKRLRQASDQLSRKLGLLPD